MRRRSSGILGAERSASGINLVGTAKLDRRRLAAHYAMREEQMIEGRGDWVRVNRSWVWRPHLTDEQERALQRDRARQREAKIEAYIAESGIPMRYRSANFERNSEGAAFEIDKGNEVAFDACKKLAETWQPGGRGVILASPGFGVGKTYLMSALGAALIRRGYSFRLISVARLLDLLRNSFGKTFATDPYAVTAEQIFTEYGQCDALCLDEMGGESIKSGEAGNWAREQVLKLIDERSLNRRTTFGTTNLRRNPAKDAKTGRPIECNTLTEHYGGRTMSRLFEGSDYLTVKGRDRRVEPAISDPFADVEGEIEAIP